MQQNATRRKRSAKLSPDPSRENAVEDQESQQWTPMLLNHALSKFVSCFSGGGRAEILAQTPETTEHEQVAKLLKTTANEANMTWVQTSVWVHNNNNNYYYNNFNSNLYSAFQKTQHCFIL